MRITRLTPEQARAAGQMLARAMAGLRRLFQQIAAAALRALEALSPVVRRLTAPTRTDRPAWASPYGPTPHRR